MKKTVKILSLLLAVVMILGTLAGCKNEKETENPEYVYLPEYHQMEGLPEGNINYMQFANGKAYFIFYEYNNDYDDDWVNDNISAEPLEEETIIATDEDIIEAPMEKYDTVATSYSLYTCNLDGTELTKLEGFFFPTNDYETMENGVDEHYSYMSDMFVSSDGTVYLSVEESTVTYEVPNSFDPETDNKWEYNSDYKTDYFLIKLNADGSEAERLELTIPSSSEENYFYMNNLCVADNGNIYAGNYDCVYVYDSKGNFLYSVENNQINNIFTMADGKVYANGWNDEGNGYNIYKFDDASKSVVKYSETKNTNLYEVIPSKNADEVFYQTNNGVFAFNIKTDTNTKIFEWLECEISPDDIFKFTQDGENFAVVTDSWDSEGNSKTEFITLVKTPYSEVANKETITIACNYLSWDLRNKAIEFNKKSDKYKIKILDYSEYNTGDDYEAGMTKLNTEIIAGNIPDIFCLDGYSMPVEKYESKGLLEDLTPYMNKTFGEGAFIDAFFDTLRDEDGKLYEVYSAFDVVTAFGLKKVVGEGELTFAKMNEAFSTLQEDATVFGPWYTVSSALDIFIYRNIKRFVDWDTGECNFDTSEFAELLKVLKNFKSDEEMAELYKDDSWWEENSESDRTLLLSGRQLLIASDISNFNYSRNIFYQYNMNDISFVGYPGSGSTFVGDGIGFAISSKSTHKEGAWEFISQFLTEEYQTKDAWSLPTNKSAFEKLAQEAMTPEFGETDYNSLEDGAIYGYKYFADAENTTNADADGEVTENPYAYPEYNKGKKQGDLFEQPKDWAYDEYNGENIPIYSMTEEEYSFIIEIINNTKTFLRYDTSLKEIIEEEVQGFISGQKSAEDTAAMIQSRAQIYVNEQR